MTEALKGKTEAQAQALFEKFHALLTGDVARTPRCRSASWRCCPACASSRCG